VKGPYIFRSLGDVVVKGKTLPVAIFEVVGRADRTAPSRAEQTPAVTPATKATKEAQA
jgi:hypothetical protein